MIIDPSDPTLKGGVQLQKVPVIPWNQYVACGLKVYKDGEIQTCIFDPKPMVAAEETFQVLRFLVACQERKPGPVAWHTVPESVKKHFRFQDSPAV